MDVHTHNGREEFVSLLMNMSYSKMDQLGYDPTIRLDGNGIIKEIDVYNEDTKRMVPYEYVAMTAIATRCFGRHTRCYLCENMPLQQGDNGSAGTEFVVVKESWAYSTRAEDGSDKAEDTRNEALIMQKIARALEGNADLDGKYAKFIHGGTVWFDKDGFTEENNTDTAFRVLFSPEEQPEFRIYQRLAMTPCCRPLQNLANVNQLIIAVADVMEAHTAIFRECSILHRDISLNNMMFRELDDSLVGGVLIDFDCAMDLTETWKTRPERTGTYPYMSINSLEEGSLVKHTQLDDWESLTYVLCWLGATGINDDDGEAYKCEKWLPIHAWQHDDPAKVAESKCDKLATLNGFVANILKRFLKPEYSRLRVLVKKLYTTMFFNRNLSYFSHGTIKIDSLEDEEEEVDFKDCLDKDDGTELRDPFERRAKYAEHIADDLRVILDEREKAKERIRERNKQATF